MSVTVTYDRWRFSRRT